MEPSMSSGHEELVQKARAFAREHIAPEAERWEEQESLPTAVVAKLREQGYLGTVVPTEFGGRGLDLIAYGRLNEELGAASSSARGLLTVHDMVAYVLMKWGTAAQKERWLGALATGATIGAFALTEPSVGSDAAGVQCSAILEEGSYVLNGVKKWITFGQIADLVLVFAQHQGKLTAFLVERGTPGFSTAPIRGMLGARASMLAEVKLENCRVPKENLVGGIGFGLSAVATTGLELGRYSVAWGGVGVGQGCIQASMRYAMKRTQYGAQLRKHQLVQEMITEMVTNVQAARLLCVQAGERMRSGDRHAMFSIMMAKYFSSRAAARAAADAVQIHGANGCSDAYPVARHFRDAKLLEIIEGSSQMQQMAIARLAYQSLELE
jgi:alkylation response protein AidB-like acyl-CoA dehydrogenase